MSDSDEGGNYPIRAVERVCAILDVLAAAEGGVSLGALANAANLPKPSAFRYLWSLEFYNYVEKNPDDGTYSAGPSFRPRNTSVVERLRELARPMLEDLRDAFGETANLGVLEGRQVVHALVVDSPQMMRLAAREGDRGMVHSTALGKAVCSELPDEAVLALVGRAPMQRFTDRTILSPLQFLDELHTVRARGFAEDDAENQDDGRCVAAPIRGLSVLAGVSISAPRSRMPDRLVEEVGQALVRVAARLSAEMS